jgi:hypothetical protein
MAITKGRLLPLEELELLELEPDQLGGLLSQKSSIVRTVPSGVYTVPTPKLPQVCVGTVAVLPLHLGLLMCSAQRCRAGFQINKLSPLQRSYKEGEPDELELPLEDEPPGGFKVVPVQPINEAKTIVVRAAKIGFHIFLYIVAFLYEILNVVCRSTVTYCYAKKSVVAQITR